MLRNEHTPKSLQTVIHSTTFLNITDQVNRSKRDGDEFTILKRQYYLFAEELKTYAVII